jgi:hypothetical protein
MGGAAQVAPFFFIYFDNLQFNIKVVNLTKIPINTLLLNVATFFAKKENDNGTKEVSY